ncbi:MAG: helix-hairpin-helix domain-containing protein [Candidatus Paceibacterales bacterium]
MSNREIARIFYEIAEFLEMEGVAFKPYAYQRAAITLETLEKDVSRIYREGGKKAVLKIPGIGESMAEKIEEYLKTGKIKYYQDLKKKTPVDMEELIQVEGMGPKRVKVLYQKLGIRNLKDLEKAAKSHKIAPLFGFGEKTEKNILEGIAFLKRSKGRFLLGEILPKVKEIEEKLKNLKEIEKISVAGSVRRRKETIGDIDFLIVTKKPRRGPASPAKRGERGSPGRAAEKVMDFFVSLPGIVKIWGKGKTKSSIRLKEGFDVDLRVVAKKSYGSALQYFTGSKEHNITTRKIAIDKGLKLNEYGVFRGKKMIAGWSEIGVYRAIGLLWMEPELREDQGEIEAVLAGKLPKIIGYRDIKGDLHCHTKWDGGANSIEEMAEAAKERGYQYLGISDHTKFLRIEHGLSEKQLSQQRKEIDKINSNPRYRTSNFKILQGAETNILNDGSIDIKDEALKRLDYAMAGVHSNFKMPKEKMTERIIRAMKNPNIDIISHPTGRILKRRDEYQIDFDKILRAAKEFGAILEINSFPVRLDLRDQNIKKAKEAGVKMVINTDSHHKNQMGFIELGIAQARRGWAEKKDIINTQPLEKLLKFFK